MLPSKTTKSATTRALLAEINSAGACRLAERWPPALQERSDKVPMRAARPVRSTDHSVQRVSPNHPVLHFNLLPLDLQDSVVQTRVVSGYLEGLLAEVGGNSVMRQLQKTIPSGVTLDEVLRIQPSAVWRVDSTAVDAMRGWNGMVVKKMMPMAPMDDARFVASGGYLDYTHHTQPLGKGLRGFCFSNVFKQSTDVQDSAGAIHRSILASVATAISGKRVAGSEEEAIRARVMICCVNVGRISMNQPEVLEGLRIQGGDFGQPNPEVDCLRIKNSLHSLCGCDSVALVIDGLPTTSVFSSKSVAPTHVVEFVCTTKALAVPMPSEDEVTPLSAVSLASRVSKEPNRRPATAGQAHTTGSSPLELSPESTAKAIRSEMALLASNVRAQFKDIIEAAAAKRDAVLMILQIEEARMLQAAKAQPRESITANVHSLRVNTAEVLRELNKIYISGLTHAAGSGIAALRPGTAAALTPLQRRELGTEGTLRPAPVQRPGTSAVRPPRPALGPDVMVSAAQRGSAGPRQLMASGIPRPATGNVRSNF